MSLNSAGSQYDSANSSFNKSSNSNATNSLNKSHSYSSLRNNKNALGGFDNMFPMMAISEMLNEDEDDIGEGEIELLNALTRQNEELGRLKVVHKGTNTNKQKILNRIDKIEQRLIKQEEAAIVKDPSFFFNQMMIMTMSNPNMFKNPNMLLMLQSMMSQNQPGEDDGIDMSLLDKGRREKYFDDKEFNDVNQITDLDISYETIIGDDGKKIRVRKKTKKKKKKKRKRKQPKNVPLQQIIIPPPLEQKIPDDCFL